MERQITAKKGPNVVYKYDLSKLVVFIQKAPGTSGKSLSLT